MHKKLQWSARWACFLLLGLVLSGCTANLAETDESGLPPHLTVDLHLPKQLEVGASSHYTVEVFNNKQPLADAEQVEFVFWREGKRNSAVTVPAAESSPGVYTVSHILAEEGIYLVQSRVVAASGMVVPIKRIAVGGEAVKQLIELEEAKPEEGQHSGHH
ncbi:hypothetical protein SY83_03145 [Paenibacillus swuensis]|uniref:YtkA-like domain-containing protein n=1 Tax=Paenibacillus swuensis TaxID=1178515 RepID=A0A172TEL9_9BACL|nr:FixH family protein [Paenibacillus swuensis]ANE45481.1 hypothetical protein SY83_03145 [Paenibacillus swuensis]